MAVSSPTVIFQITLILAYSNMSLLARIYKLTILLNPALIQLNVLCTGLMQSLNLSNFQIFLPSPSLYAYQSTFSSYNKIIIFSDTMARPVSRPTLPPVGSLMDLYGQPVPGPIGYDKDQSSAVQSPVSHPGDSFRTPDSSLGNCGGQSDSRTSFVSSYSVFHCRYHYSKCSIPIGSST